MKKDIRLYISKEVLDDKTILKITNNNGNPISLTKAIEKIIEEKKEK